jgi:NAD(P)-dependent dehydrogenase (short-subunit alcohol dehydrogenase family)
VAPYLAMELRAHGMVVNTVNPAAIATDFRDGLGRHNPGVNKRILDMSAGYKKHTQKGIEHANHREESRARHGSEQRDWI